MHILMNSIQKNVRATAASAAAAAPKPIAIPKRKQNPKQRREWKHFGDVTAVNSMDHTTIGVDVFMEKETSEVENWIPNGACISEGWRLGFHPSEIDEIRHSSQPEATFMEIWSTRYFKAQAGKTSAAGPSAGGDAGATGGLRGRLHQSKGTDSTTDAPPAGGLRARLNTSSSTETENARTVFVGNMPDYFEDADLRSLLTGIDVTRFNIVRRERYPGGPRISNGNAFVVCRSVEETKRCIAHLNGTLTGNSVLHAQLSQPK